MIDERYRNWVKTICNKEHANGLNPMQHRAIIIELQVQLKSDYFEKQSKAKCPYDISDFRKPQKN